MSWVRPLFLLAQRSRASDTKAPGPIPLSDPTATDDKADGTTPRIASSNDEDRVQQHPLPDFASDCRLITDLERDSNSSRSASSPIPISEAAVKNDLRLSACAQEPESDPVSRFHQVTIPGTHYASVKDIITAAREFSRWQGFVVATNTHPFCPQYPHPVLGPESKVIQRGRIYCNYKDPRVKREHKGIRSTCGWFIYFGFHRDDIDYYIKKVSVEHNHPLDDGLSSSPAHVYRFNSQWNHCEIDANKSASDSCLSARYREPLNTNRSQPPESVLTPYRDSTSARLKQPIKSAYDSVVYPDNPDIRYAKLSQALRKIEDKVISNEYWYKSMMMYLDAFDKYMAEHDPPVSLTRASELEHTGTECLDASTSMIGTARPHSKRRRSTNEDENRLGFQ